jgi:hypothetical protein
LSFSRLSGWVSFSVDLTSEVDRDPLTLLTTHSLPMRFRGRNVMKVDNYSPPSWKKPFQRFRPNFAMLA